MRLDIDQYDDYPPTTQDLCRRAKIHLNGEEVLRVTVADEEQGYIIRHKTDLLGHLVRDGDSVATEKLYGTVRIVDPAALHAGQKA